MVLAGAAALIAASVAVAAVNPSTTAETGDETSVPFGWVDFCARYAGACVEEDQAPQDIDLTPSALRRIVRINAQVNRSIEPITDLDQFGVIDRWDLPADGRGDCEDYALLKRTQLIEAGFPRSALLLTVVKQSNGEGHSILTVKTSRGDYVLDNLSDAVKPWAEAPYRFVKRQSQENENVWVAIAPEDAGRRFVAR
jgi:predicted transglutaminase-like cysteine proteinase